MRKTISKPSKLKSIIGDAARFLGRHKGKLLLLALAGMVTHGFKQDYNKKYNLVIAIPFGPTLVPHESLLVTHVQRMSDGSVCFDLVTETKPGCIKAANYYLIEANVE